MATNAKEKADKKMAGAIATAVHRSTCLVVFILMVLCLIPACPSPPGIQELKKEVEALKAEVAGLKEKIIQVEASQKVILEMAKGVQQPKESGMAPPETLQPAPGPAGVAPLTVGELFKNKDQLVGTKVTVKGVPGPVMMHKKTLFLSGPEGMVEVLYGNLQDKKQVERLTAQTIETPIIVSGLLSTAPGQTKNAVRLVIMADMVEF